ncbi:uncharacterized protein LOC119568246, partial [Penaeus monodon]|uniref:uncharacterized protein LOC119568246 n=1 Tax=Penaeus monodon TaxID=6687 RepID=UPI0018A7DCF4
SGQWIHWIPVWFIRCHWLPIWIWQWIRFSSGFGGFQSGSSGAGFGAAGGSGLQFGSESDDVFGIFEPLNLPAEATRLLGKISTSFACLDRPYGYYADEENSCHIFHICYPALFANGVIETSQYSFLCGEGSRFDQKELTCVAESEAIPCQESSNFFFKNEQFGLPKEKI